jgi:hypothetical protein
VVIAVLKGTSGSRGLDSTVLATDHAVLPGSHGNADFSRDNGHRGGGWGEGDHSGQGGDVGPGSDWFGLWILLSGIMKTPYVCAVCGGSIQIGRHKSGWRHIDEARPDHRVRRIDRTEYEQLQVGSESHSSDNAPSVKIFNKLVWACPSRLGSMKARGCFSRKFCQRHLLS